MGENSNSTADETLEPKITVETNVVIEVIVEGMKRESAFKDAAISGLGNVCYASGYAANGANASTQTTPALTQVCGVGFKLSVVRFIEIFKISKNKWDINYCNYH